MDTSIPSSSAVQAAKDKRDRLRKVGSTVDEDYISLSVAKRSDMPQGPHPESRLMREDDELGEGDDGENLVASLWPKRLIHIAQNMPSIPARKNA